MLSTAQEILDADQYIKDSIFYKISETAYSQKAKVQASTKNARNYYLLAIQKVEGLWKCIYKDDACGKKIYTNFTNHIKKFSNRCAYCQDRIFHNANCNIDHILPSSLYPEYTFSEKNLVPVCVTCNIIKSDEDFYKITTYSFKYEENDGKWLCFHPKYHNYNDHIDRLAIQTNLISFRAYIGKTSEGRMLCTNFLYKVSEFESRAHQNPDVAQAIESLSAIIGSTPNHSLENLKRFIKILSDAI